MASLPPSLTRLIAALSHLPGVGPRSAERLALHLVQGEPGGVKELARAIVEARETVRNCPTCGALTETDPCDLCRDDRRDRALICVVERPVDILLVEKAGVFRGRFHVLGGKLSPLNGVEPEDLRIAELERRVGPEGIREVILALPTDVEGDATCHYLAQRLREVGIQVTRLAHGLPAGSGLEYADELTLTRALEGRSSVL
ncbi:MAG: recombination protein RecR [Verrucomicrobiae bacterium]|nr:recombination protein RecR [Verrucomicrobiae bacterium]